MDKKRNYATGYGYDSAFPLLLRALMENKNDISPLRRTVSQSELAEAVGVTRQAISTYALGTSVPDMLRFKAIADFFHVNYGFLLGATNIISNDSGSLIEKAKFRPQTQSALLKICSTPRNAASFAFLVETQEFYDIVNAISAHLSISWTKSVSSDELIAADKEIVRQTGGALRVVPASLEKNMLIMNAQSYLADAMKSIDMRTDPTSKDGTNRIWRSDENK